VLWQSTQSYVPTLPSIEPVTKRHPCGANATALSSAFRSRMRRECPVLNYQTRAVGPAVTSQRLSALKAAPFTLAVCVKIRRGSPPL